MSTSTEYWCLVCDQQIEGDDIEDRHSDPFTGADIHAQCCAVCQCEDSNKYFTESEWMDRYIKRPTFCPYCESEGVRSYNIKPEYDFSWTIVECLSCEKRWKEIFSLTAIEELEHDCPVGEVANDPHTFRPGSGVVVEWSVMGDPRTSVEVCADCAKGAVDG